MDDLVVRVDSPQEDEFALCGLGSASFYESFLAPCGWRGRLKFLDWMHQSDSEQQDWLRTFKLFLALLAVYDRRPALLKSPTHTFRLSGLATTFPKASFIYLLRDPMANFTSNVRMWRAMFDLYGLEPYEAAEVPAMICELYTSLTAQVLDALPFLPRERFVVVAYESLIAEPTHTLRKLFEHFSWPWSDEYRIALDEKSAAARSYQPFTGSAESVTPELRARLVDRHEALRKSLAPFLIQH